MYLEDACFCTLLMLKVSIIKLAIEKIGKATITKTQEPPQPTLDRLDTGWLIVPTGLAVLMISYAPEDCVQTVVETRADIKDNSFVVDWPCGSCVLLFERVYFRTAPPGIPYASFPIPISHPTEEGHEL